MRARTLLLPVCLLLTACNTPPAPLPSTDAERRLLSEVRAVDPAKAERARQTIVGEHPDWDAATKTAVVKGQISLGMTRLQVRAAWGDGLRLVESGGDSDFLSSRHPERWVYDRAPFLVVARFENDSLLKVGAFNRDEEEVALPRGEFGFLLPAVMSEQPAQTVDYWTNLDLRADRAERTWK